MVEGTDNITLDGIDRDWFEKTSKELRNESFKFNPARRVWIPKANGKKRPLGISSPRDKIIQQSTKMVLEVILEPKFSDHSHGFRPRRGCHSALREIRNWKGVAWFIEGDIKGFFDNIDHHILEGLITNHFKDARLVHLYWKFVKAGYIEYSNNASETFIDSNKGVPQGGILSPLLSNLYLHELDKYMEKLMKNREDLNENQKPYKTNPQYHVQTMKIHRLRRKIDRTQNFDERTNLLKLLKNLRSLRRRDKSIIPNPNFVKFKYVRYADDWIIGIWGPRSEATNLKENIRILLEELKLTLSEEKTLITNARAGRAVFLGTHIKRLSSNKDEAKVVKGKKIPTGNLLMIAPISKLVNKAIDKGLLSIINDRWIPKPIKMLVPLEDSDIILRFNTIIRGILNYYSFVDNRQKLSKLSYIIKECLWKTLSLKHKINKSTSLSRYGKNITVIRRNSISIKKIWFYEPKLVKEPMKFMGLGAVKDPFDSMNWRASTKTNFDFPCAVCGSSTNVEMHHIKHIKTINLKLSKFDQAVASVNRKQVPLCRPCHLDVHNGLYVGSPLRYWRPISSLKVKLI
jgi:nicotine oxidoreductase